MQSMFLAYDPAPPPLVPRKPLRVRVLRSLAESVIEAVLTAVVLAGGVGIAGYVIRATAEVELVIGPDATAETSTDLGPTTVGTDVLPEDQP